MEGLKQKSAELVDHVEDMAGTFYKLTLLKATQKATNVGSSFLVILATSVFGLFALLFLGVALCLWLGDLVNSRAGGFLIGAGIFLLILGTVIALRKKIVFPYFRNLIIRKIYDKAD